MQYGYMKDNFIFGIMIFEDGVNTRSSDVKSLAEFAFRINEQGEMIKNKITLIFDINKISFNEIFQELTKITNHSSLIDGYVRCILEERNKFQIVGIARISSRNEAVYTTSENIEKLRKGFILETNVQTPLAVFSRR